MTGLISIIRAHPAWDGVGAYYVFSNAVGSLPPPTDKSSAFYRWFYAFSHGLAGNIKYAIQQGMPHAVAPDQPKEN